MIDLNKNIKIIGEREHKKASERYIDVIFHYDGTIWEGSVPIEYRRTGVHAETEEDKIIILNKTYEQMNPINYDKWENEQNKFWDESNKDVTRPFFELTKMGKWKCVICELPPNRNWARRWQDIKECGYTTATNTKMYCENCDKNTTHVMVLPIPRGNKTGYETWTPKLRKKIMDVLGNYDVFEDRTHNSLLPDHKFPEIRWDENTKDENHEDMENDEIVSKFQLITNQRNQQKREVCRNCYQTGKRGFPFGIKFYYKGTENWPINVPKRGKIAEKGCIGCGWYDLKEWKEKLNEYLNNL